MTNDFKFYEANPALSQEIRFKQNNEFIWRWFPKRYSRKKRKLLRAKRIPIKFVIQKPIWIITKKLRDKLGITDEEYKAFRGW